MLGRRRTQGWHASSTLTGPNLAMSARFSTQRKPQSVCQFGLSRSGLYAVADWYIESAGRRFEQICGGWLDDIDATGQRLDRFITLEALRQEFVQQGLERSARAGASAWIQLRDPYNWLASLQRGVTERSVNWPDAVSLRKWVDYARLCAGGCEWVSFNRWFSDADYRRGLAVRFDFRVNRAGEAWQRVPSRGGGSSFDGLRYAGRAQGMGVLERYRLYLDDPRWRAQFDEEVVTLARTLFDMKRPW
jgi:hypothetical protein